MFFQFQIPIIPLVFSRRGFTFYYFLKRRFFHQIVNDHPLEIKREENIIGFCQICQRLVFYVEDCWLVIQKIIYQQGVDDSGENQNSQNHRIYESIRQFCNVLKEDKKFPNLFFLCYF